MSIKAFVNGLVRAGGYDLTADINAVALASGVDALENTSLASTNHTYQPGLKTVKGSVSGFWDTANDAYLSGNMSVTDVVTLAMGIAEGTVAYFMKSMQAQYKTIGDGVGKLAAMSLSLSAAGQLVRGLLMVNKTGISATASGTGFQLGASAATQTLFASLHVTGITGTGVTLTVTVESDTANNFPSPTTVATFADVTDITGVGAQLVSVAGANTDTWYRFTYTISGTGSFDFAGAAGIDNTH